MQAIIGGKRYDTETATLLASDRYFDGHNWERHGRNTYLYKTKRGNCFVYHATMWQGERDSIKALSIGDAKALYEALPEHDEQWETAFGEPPEEA